MLSGSSEGPWADHEARNPAARMSTSVALPLGLRPPVSMRTALRRRVARSEGMEVGQSAVTCEAQLPEGPMMRGRAVALYSPSSSWWSMMAVIRAEGDE